VVTPRDVATSAALSESPMRRLRPTTTRTSIRRCQEIGGVLAGAVGTVARFSEF
jgi:hypothetical protein